MENKYRLVLEVDEAIQSKELRDVRRFQLTIYKIYGVKVNNAIEKHFKSDFSMEIHVLKVP